MCDVPFPDIVFLYGFTCMYVFMPEIYMCVPSLHAFLLTHLYFHHIKFKKIVIMVLKSKMIKEE